MKHPPGTVILPCKEDARFHLFTYDLRALKLPPDSSCNFGIGNSIVDNLNQAIEQLPDNSEWIWIIGDDHRFGPDTVLNLLDRGLDVVACLTLARHAPWPLVHYEGEIPGSSTQRRFYRPLPIGDVPEDDQPFEVVASGTTGMLVRRHVLDALARPLFRNSDTTILNEDLEFCRAVRDAGFKIHVDPECALGHMGIVNYTPAYHEGAWGIMVEFGGGNQMFWPGGVELDAYGRTEVAA